MANKSLNTKKKQPIRSSEPLRYDFFIVQAIFIYEAAKEIGASDKGALMVIAKAANESSYGTSENFKKSNNLFGIMAPDKNTKANTSHGNLKDFVNYQASVRFYFDFINDVKKQWTGLDLIKKEDFTFQDIDNAFNTGTDFPTDKENLAGKLAYNVSTNKDEKKNHYGEFIYSVMKTSKRLMIQGLRFLICNNHKENQYSFEKDATNKFLMDEVVKFCKVKPDFILTDSSRLMKIYTAINNVRL